MSEAGFIEPGMLVGHSPPVVVNLDTLSEIGASDSLFAKIAP
jgi:hypothetical protein